MLGIFNKKPLRSSAYPRHNRQDIDCDVYIKRLGKESLRAVNGNISEGGIYLELEEHDLEKGKKVEIVLERKEGTVSHISRMMGIIIRIEGNGVALVTYKKEELTSAQDQPQDTDFSPVS